MNTAQSQFLSWSGSPEIPWPEVVENGFTISLLDHAMQEGVAQYLKTGEMVPLLEFIKTAAEKFLKNCEENTIPFSRSEKNASPDLWKRKSLFQNLCEVYGFCGDFDSAWKTCVKTGLDHQHNYLIFGTNCRKRKFDTRQAYYFPLYRPPLTDAGRKQKAEIFPLVDDELKKFERQEKCNLFDYYLNLAEVATIRCFDVPDLDHFSSPTGQDVFERSEFQSSILREFQYRFTLGLQPFENRLKALFDDPNKYEKAKESTLQGFKTRLGRPLRHKHSFLYDHFWKVTFNPEKFGMRKNAHSLEAIYQGGHHVMLPYFPDLIQNCMVMHIANIFRSSENRFRQSLGLNGVGDGWVSEATLIALLKKAFPDEIIIHHATPEWLGRQHLDIFFPRVNLAVEYQGVQHQRSVAIFGGESGFRVRQGLDKKKKQLCETNNCKLIEVFKEDRIETILEQIGEHLVNVKIKKAPKKKTHVKFDSKADPALGVKSVHRQIPNKYPTKQKSTGGWKKQIGKDDLAACARHGDRDLILRMASEGADLIGFENSSSETLLFIACIEGNVETATALLDVGLDPNARDYRQASILSKICNRGSVRPKPEIVGLLLERGADPRLHGTLTPSIFGRCGYALPMIGCSIDCFLDCAKVLFKHTKNVNIRQPQSMVTPLMCACYPMERHRHEHRSLDMIRWLIEAKADLNARTKAGLTPMDFALGASLYSSGISNLRAENIASRQILKLLWNKGGRPSEDFKPILKQAFKKL